MKTSLTDHFRNSEEGSEAEAILRSCVHCGFCLATCPTYELLGDERDSPRGRIYLIKEMLEGQTPSQRTQLHLDRCLTCRACETTCPSGVRYGRLVDIGRRFVDERVERTWMNALKRWGLRMVFPYPTRLTRLLGLAGWVRPIIAAKFKSRIPLARKADNWPVERHARKMLVLDGCVQASVAPNINAAAARVLDRSGISLVSVKESGCCGAVSYHLSARDEGLAFMRRNIDAWWPHIEQGAEAIIITASGCGVMIKEYGELLEHDREYAEKAARISELTVDIAEVFADETLVNQLPKINKTIAFHSPCTLQHGQQLNGRVESILNQCGISLTPVQDAHLCCGSAGTYSILQADISKQLLKNKISALELGDPELIATANIGCMLQLQRATQLPVKHWIEVFDANLGCQRSSDEIASGVF